MGSSNREEEPKNVDAEAAELFEAVSHPTRVRILRTLSVGPMGFADLKHALDIKSSGNLSHHLGKLRGLVETDSQGHYTLTDRGREAFCAFERASSSKPATEARSLMLARFLAVAGIALMADSFILAFGVKSAIVLEPLRFTTFSTPITFNTSTPYVLKQRIELVALNQTDKLGTIVYEEPVLGPNQLIIAGILAGAGAGLTTLASPIAYLWPEVKRQEKRVDQLERATKRNSKKST